MRLPTSEDMLTGRLDKALIVWDCAGKLVTLSNSAQYCSSTLSEAIHVPEGGWCAKPDGLTCPLGRRFTPRRCSRRTAHHGY